jgi:hypothetical protein
VGPEGLCSPRLITEDVRENNNIKADETDKQTFQEVRATKNVKQRRKT